MDDATANEIIGTLHVIRNRIEELLLGRIRVDIGFSAMTFLNTVLLALILWRVW